MNGFSRKEVIKGVGFFDDVIDGDKVNTGSIFIEQPMTGENVRGFRTVEFKTADGAEVVRRLMHLEFPITAEVFYEMKVGKGRHSIVIVDCKPVEPARPQPQPDRKVA